jgi:hypothetical protein
MSKIFGSVLMIAVFFVKEKNMNKEWWRLFIFDPFNFELFIK